MPEHLLDVPDVGTAFEHERRHRVPEQVAGATLPDIRGLHVLRHDQAQVARREAIALRNVS